MARVEVSASMQWPDVLLAKLTFQIYSCSNLAQQ